jgi:hypothetical protein
VEQEEPLDLSMKEKKGKNKEETFDLAKFYHAYYAISSRSLPAYPSLNFIAKHRPVLYNWVGKKGEQEAKAFIQHF